MLQPYRNLIIALVTVARPLRSLENASNFTCLSKVCWAGKKSLYLFYTFSDRHNDEVTTDKPTKKASFMIADFLCNEHDKKMSTADHETHEKSTTSTAGLHTAELCSTEICWDGN